jgi:hypothetical protein
MRSDYEFGKRRWFDRPEMLMAAGSGALASALLLLVLPSIGTLFIEILAGLVMVGRAFVVRRRERTATQLRLALPNTSDRLRLPARYELVLIIVAILSYGAIATVLRSIKTPEALLRVVPLLVFAAGLLTKNHILRAIARSVICFRERLGRSESRPAQAARGES